MRKEWVQATCWRQCFEFLSLLLHSVGWQEGHLAHKHLYHIQVDETSISCRWWTRTVHCIMANVLPTKVEAQCDKLGTELSCQHTCDGWHFRVIASYLSKVANFNLLHLHLVPPLGLPRSSFVAIFSIRKLESLGYHMVLFAWSYV